MKKEEFLSMSLRTGLKAKCRVNISNWEIFELSKIEYKNNYYGMVKYPYCNKELFYSEKYIHPIARRLSDLAKPITHNGETFVPIVELAKMCKVNLKLTGEWVVDESLAQNCVRIQDNYFWYNGDSFLYSILAKTEYKMIVHNQQELLFKLIEWHFNLMDESEPFIPVTEEFNPYK